MNRYADVSGSRGQGTVDAIIELARERATNAVGARLSSPDVDPELVEKHARMQEKLEADRLKRTEAERKERLQRMISQAEEAKKSSDTSPDVAALDSDSDDDDVSIPTFQSLSLPTGTGGIIDEDSLGAAREVLMKRHAIDLKATSGPAALSREALETKIVDASNKVRRYEAKVRASHYIDISRALVISWSGKRFTLPCSLLTHTQIADCSVCATVLHACSVVRTTPFTAHITLAINILCLRAAC